jgi:soluble lytic murein transglycosylase
MLKITLSDAPNRVATPSLSSAAFRFIIPTILASAALAATPACAQPVPGSNSLTTATLSRSAGTLMSGLFEWKNLQQSDSLPFTSYANFLTSYSGWPGELSFRKNAERAIRSGVEAPDQVIAYFRRLPPLTPPGHLRFAEALSARGLRDEARNAARNAWISGALAPEDENLILGSFADAIQPGDHDARMDRLLWDRATTNAARQILLVSSAKRTVFEARLAMLSKAPDAALKAQAVFELAKNDPGFLIDRNWWQRNTGQLPQARNLLAAPRQLAAPPLDPEKWLGALTLTARGASNDAQWSAVYNIARQLNDAYPAGTDVRERPFAERDDYTTLAWMGGSAALNKLGRPADAIALFERYAGAAKSAQTQAKGYYWAGRAAEVAGQRDNATRFYERAGQYFDQFHGQLALERLGRPVTPPSVLRTVEISGAARSAFDDNSLIKAVKLLGQQGQWADQTKFIRVIAATANTDLDAILASELAIKINRPDLSVMVGRNARMSGLGDYLRTAFPQVQVPQEIAPSWTMIHAISRQESQFDRQIVSRAGARGLMQLMPGTARETAPSAGVSYDPASLNDPTYNIRLGSTYFGQMMDLYGGSYVLAVAAYNAGPGNVNKWLRTIGDPRVPGTDVLDWIERIPLSETRNYVHRVLENAVVYDLINPKGANIRSRTPLSAYLGKSQPG